MFRQRLKGGHRVGLPPTQNPTVQNDIISQQTPISEDNSWNWGSTTDQFSGSIQENQTTVHTPVSSNLVPENQQHLYLNSQYVPSEVQSPNNFINSNIEGNIEQQPTVGGHSQNKDEWKWEGNNWDEWESDSGIKTKKQNAIDTSHNIQETFTAPYINRPQNFPVYDSEFDKIDVNYSENIVTTSGQGIDVNENSRHFPKFSNDNPPTSDNCNQELIDNARDFNQYYPENDTRNTYSSLHLNKPQVPAFPSAIDSEKMDIYNSGQITNQVTEFDSVPADVIIEEPQITMVNDNYDHGNEKNDWNWEQDNWSPEQSEQITERTFNNQHQMEQYPPSAVVESNYIIENVSVQEAQLVEEEVANVDNVTNQSHEVTSGYDGIVKNELPTQWENDNWSENGANNFKCDQYQKSDIDAASISDDVINNLSSLPPEIITKQSTDINYAGVIFEGDKHDKIQTSFDGSITKPETTITSTECLSEDPFLLPNDEVQNITAPFDEVIYTSTLDRAQHFYLPSEEEFGSKFAVTSEQLTPQEEKQDDISKYQGELCSNDDLNESHRKVDVDLKQYDKNILSIDDDEPIPDVKPRLREEILSKYKAAISRSRTTSLTDSNKDSNITVLDDELHGIFSSPTNLVNYPSPNEYRIRTSSLTRASQSKTDISLEPETNIPLGQDELNTEETEEITTEMLSQPSVTEIQSFNNNFYIPTVSAASFSSVSTVPEQIDVHKQIDVHIDTITVDECDYSKVSQCYDPIQAQFPSSAITLSTVKPRKDSPFQPPKLKHLQDSQRKSSFDKFDYNKDKNIYSDHCVEPTAQKSDSNSKGENFNAVSLQGIVNAPNEEVAAERSIIDTETGGVHSLNIISDAVVSPVPVDSLKPVIKLGRPAKEEKFTRMIPGESSKGKRGPSSHPAPPAMPTGRFVTGNDDPQPLAPMRIKQEPNEVRSPPDGPDTLSPINHDASVNPPVRSETIGSEEPLGITKARKDKKPDSARDRGVDYESSSGEYYADRYPDVNKRPSRYYYREGSPNSRPSYEREYDSKFHMPRYDSDDEDEEDRRYSSQLRNRRHRSYREDNRKYPSNIKQEQGYNRQRDHRRQEPSRSYRLSTTDDDPFYPKSDRSRPSSRSSSPNNLERMPSKHSNARYPDKNYERHHRRPSQRDYHPDRNLDKGNGREAYFGGYGGQYPEQYGSQGMYDQSYYYYHYQKYMEQHPYYREYYRQYYGRNYGHPGGNNEVFPDEKSSMRSGRSSVNDELKKSMSSLTAPDQYEFIYGQPPPSPYYHSQYQQDYPDGSTYGGYAPSSIYNEQNTTRQNNFYESADISVAPSLADDIAQEKENRLTPHQFGGPHFISRFTPGGKLIVVLPNDPKDGEKAIVQIKDIQQLLAVQPEYRKRIQQMKNYAGPIAYNDTHKDVVIRFCAYQIEEAATNSVLEDKQSVILLWEYLSLLVKQNGKVCGADLASLLLEQKSKTGSPIPVLPEESPLDAADASDERGNNRVSEIDLASVRPFTEYLCLGRRKDAVEYAIGHGLWGHAMMLASKMDQVTHTKVMTAFLNSIPTSDVLQTALQHMSGKRPDVTKNFNPDRWGDWREHLAVLVSNSTGNSQRDRSSIIGLGDTLASRGQVHAAHICYIAGEAPWGTFADKMSKIVLIGSSHNKSFKAFASEEAFQCTEVYEYAKSLDGTNEIFHTFQSYKLVYALRLAECGFASDALRYCEVIGNVVCQSPQYYQEDFISQVLELASRLKYYDAHYQMGGEVNEMADPEWLQQLSNLLYMMQTQKNETQGDALVENAAVADDICVTDSKPVIVPETEKRKVQDLNDNFNRTMQSPQQTSTPIPRYAAGGQQVLHENNVQLQTSSNRDNYKQSSNYVTPPPMDVPHMQTPDAVPLYDQTTSPAQHQEPPLSWKPVPDMIPAAQPEIPPVKILQRRTSEEEEYWAAMGNKPTNMQPRPSEKTAIKSELKEDDGLKDDDDKRTGFFGSLFGGWKKSNQAKLPDDSNPSIVWDETKKKWVNRDGEEEPEGPPPPPPTGMSVPPIKPGASFRGASRMSRYVDPVGDSRRSSGAPVLASNGITSMSPTGAHIVAQNGAVPAMSPISSTFLPPGANGNVHTSPVLNQPTSVQDSISNRQDADGDSGMNAVPMMGAPPMFNPNQFGATAVPSSGSLPRKAGPARRTFGQR